MRFDSLLIRTNDQTLMAPVISGPINTLAVHPQGKGYASGAEDGFVRVHWVSPHVGS